MKSSLKMIFVSLITVLLCSTFSLGQQVRSTQLNISGTETGFGWDFKATLNLICGPDTVISVVNVTTCPQGLVNCGRLPVTCPTLKKGDIEKMCGNKQNCPYNTSWRCQVITNVQVSFEIWYTCSQGFTESSTNEDGTTAPFTQTTLPDYTTNQIDAAEDVHTVGSVLVTNADPPQQQSPSTIQPSDVVATHIPFNTGLINNGNLIVVIGILSAVIIILVLTLAATLFFFLYLKPRHHRKTEGRRNHVTYQNNGADVTTNDVDTGYYNVPEANNVSSELALETNGNVMSGNEDYEYFNIYANDHTNNLYSSLS